MQNITTKFEQLLSWDIFGCFSRDSKDRDLALVQGKLASNVVGESTSQDDLDQH